MRRTKPVYLLLTRSSTLPSRIIHLATGISYTHVGLSLDGPDGPFFTFARKYSRLPLPGGFVQEMPGAGYLQRHPDTPCCLLQLHVSANEEHQMRQKITAMERERPRYKYSILGVIGCFFNIPVCRDMHFFCSEFVDGLLQSAGVPTFHNPPSLVRPSDFLTLRGAIIIHQGPVCGLMEGRAYDAAS